MNQFKRERERETDRQTDRQSTRPWEDHVSALYPQQGWTIGTYCRR